MQRNEIRKRYREVMRTLGYRNNEKQFDNIENDPFSVYDELERKNILSGRRMETALAITIYLSLRRQGYVFYKKDFIKSFDITGVGFRNNLKKLREMGMLVQTHDRLRDKPAEV